MRTRSDHVTLPVSEPRRQRRGAAGPCDRRRRPDRVPARRIRALRARGLPDIRRRPDGSGEVEELEDDVLRSAAGLMVARRQARRPEDLRSGQRSDGGVRRQCDAKRVGRRTKDEGGGGIRAEPQEIPAHRARHTGSLSTAYRALDANGRREDPQVAAVSGIGGRTAAASCDA